MKVEQFKKVFLQIILLVFFLIPSNIYGFDEEFPPISSLKVPDYVKVIDFTGRGEVSLEGALSPDIKKPILIIIADRIRLGNNSFSFCTNNLSKQVIMIADEIRVIGREKFDFGLQPPWSGPFCTLHPLPTNPSDTPLGLKIPPVISIVTPRLTVEKLGAVCLVCPTEKIVVGEQGSMSFGGSYGGFYPWAIPPNIESATFPSITIATEDFDLSSKADYVVELLQQAKNSPMFGGKLSNSEFLEGIKPWLGMFELPPNDDGIEHPNLPTLESFEWAKPFLKELEQRKDNTPISDIDIDWIRRFLKIGFREVPDRAAVTSFFTYPTTLFDNNGKLVGFNLTISPPPTRFYYTKKLSEGGQQDPNAARALSIWTVHRDSIRSCGNG